MTKSVYVIGGAGSGKSTFVGELLAGREFGPLEDLYQKPNSRGTVITLRGHRLPNDGLYLGCMRDSFPGTDGLDRVSYIPGEDWLDKDPLPGWIIGEGATLAVRRFLYALHERTDLLLVHLWAEEFVKELRFEERGSTQKETFVTGTATRSANLLVSMKELGCRTIDVDTSDDIDWLEAQRLVRKHLSL